MRRMELGLGVLGLLAGVVIALWKTEPVAFSLAATFKWTGIVLLAQGLCRDLILIAGYREFVRDVSVWRSDGLVICLPSVIGATSIAIYGVLLFYGRNAPLEGTLGLWAIWFSSWWVIGYWIRNTVIVIRTDKDQIHRIIGT